MDSPHLPIDEILPDLCRELRRSRRVVLSAPPGAGKTTRVPLALLGEEWLQDQKVIMLEPRRLAARRAAEFMARGRGEEPGETVGYRIRGESRAGSRTRLEVVTEGILTRILHGDPSLEGTGLLVFDEFHERSIHADLGLALALDVCAHLRDDLRILVMSATLDGIAVAEYLGQAPVLESRGRAHPVELRYLNFPVERALEVRVAEVIARAMLLESGDILVFLPGWREIRKVAALLEDASLPEEIELHQLHGEAPYAQQQRALAPALSGKRKVILSTSLAETSLTIDGVRVVVDGGLVRTSRFDPRRGMSGLVTSRVSRATADQRAGRAGRQGPGVCYRLWTQAEQEELPRYPTPEILVTDLAALALELARWGDPQGKTLHFLDAPPAPHLARARRLLGDLGALDQNGRLSEHGAAMARVPAHPRLAHMMLRARELGSGWLASELAALLEERDPLRGRGSDSVDLRIRLDAIRSGGEGVDRAVRARALGEAHRLRASLGMTGEPRDDVSRAGLLLALAYPERIARIRAEGTLRYQTVGGTGAVLPPRSALAREPLLAIAEVDAADTEARILLAAPLSLEDLLACAGDRITEQHETDWDGAEGAVRARRIRRLGELVLDERAFEPPPAAREQAMLQGIRSMGLDALPWDGESRSLLVRSEWLRGQTLVGEDWVDLSEERLLQSLESWLAPFLGESRRREDLARVNLPAALRSMIPTHQLRAIDELAPTHLRVPTGSRIALEYAREGPPVLAVRLQEMFGERETPRIARGTVPVLIHLLSPARRPLAVTQDLRSFWQNVYPEVRKEMRGRYAKHHWPENPLEAEPTRRTKRRRLR
jgi:ATP-dependent helicase HrpB